jgi:hypothetical protein
VASHAGDNRALILISGLNPITLYFVLHTEHTKPTCREEGGTSVVHDAHNK